MAVSYIITVLDHDHLEVVTEQEIEAAFPNSSYPASILNAIEVVLDERSARKEADAKRD